MKSLVVEDDFTSRILLQSILSRYGDCHVAVNGKEAVSAFLMARNEGHPYDLICMDIRMPEMSGQEALNEIRANERAAGISSSEGVKIVMMTGVDDPKSVMDAFHKLCDAYLVKPIDKAKVLDCFKELRLI